MRQLAISNAKKKLNSRLYKIAAAQMRQANQMEGVELQSDKACINKRKRFGRDAAFADAKTAVFEAKMRKRAADDAVRGGTGDAAAAEEAAADVESSVEKAALVAAIISNKAIEKAARTANDEIAAYINGADLKQALSASRKHAKALTEAQAAAVVAVDYAGKIGGSVTMSLPFSEMPLFHVRRRD